MDLGIPGIEDAERIGAGGAAVVYAAWQPEFGRKVAVKVFAADEDPRRVERERLAVGPLSDHENVVPVHDSGVTADGRPYLLMAFMPGGSLAGRVHAGGPFSPARATGIGLELARAVAEAHRHGVRHRDIKPQNVLFDRSDRPRLADFGIADLGERTFRTSADTVSGTVSYMAPEVIRGEDGAEAADLYSLAATLYFAVEGRDLFPARPGESYETLVYRRATAPQAVTFSLHTPPWLRRVLQQALAPEPGGRYASVDDFAAALRAAGGSAITVDPVPARPEALRPAPVAPVRAAATSPPPPTPPTPPPPVTAGRTPFTDGKGFLAVVAVLALIVTGLGAAALDQPHPADPAPAASVTGAARPAATDPKVDPRTSVADLNAIRAASGQADPVAGLVEFELWAPGVHRTQAWLTAAGAPRVTELYAVSRGQVERAVHDREPGPGDPIPPPEYSLFRLSDVRFDLIPDLVRQARQACSPVAGSSDVARIAVQKWDTYVARPTVRIDLYDPVTQRHASLDFTVEGRRAEPGQPCRFG